MELKRIGCGSGNVSFYPTGPVSFYIISTYIYNRYFDMEGLIASL